MNILCDNTPSSYHQHHSHTMIQFSDEIDYPLFEQPSISSYHHPVQEEPLTFTSSHPLFTPFPFSSTTSLENHHPQHSHLPSPPHSSSTITSSSSSFDSNKQQHQQYEENLQEEPLVFNHLFEDDNLNINSNIIHHSEDRNETWFPSIEDLQNRNTQYSSFSSQNKNLQFLDKHGKTLVHSTCSFLPLSSPLSSFFFGHKSIHHHEKEIHELDRMNDAASICLNQSVLHDESIHGDHYNPWIRVNKKQKFDPMTHTKINHHHHHEHHSPALTIIKNDAKSLLETEIKLSQHDDSHSIHSPNLSTIHNDDDEDSDHLPSFILSPPPSILLNDHHSFPPCS